MGVLEQVNYRIKDEEPKNDCFQYILLFINYNKVVYFCKKYLFVYKNRAEDNANLRKSEKGETMKRKIKKIVINFLCVLPLWILSILTAYAFPPSSTPLYNGIDAFGNLND